MSVAPPLPSMLRALAGELAALHVQASALQEVLPGAGGGRATVGLQRLDALTQTLDALAAYTKELAAAVAAGGAPDPARAAQAVPLAAVALRLALAGATEPHDEAGDCDIF